MNEFESLVYAKVCKNVSIHRTLDWLVGELNFDNEKSDRAVDVITTKEVEKALDKLIEGGLVNVLIGNSSTYKHFKSAHPQDLVLDANPNIKSDMIKWC